MISCDGIFLGRISVTPSTELWATISHLFTMAHSPLLLSFQGVCYEQLDRRNEAIKCYERAVCNNDRL